MVRLREIPRTAAFAWSTGTATPLLVTGTRAGAVSADFSDDTVLELWDLQLDDQGQGLELQPVTRIQTDSSFYDIAWGPPSAEHPRGIIAGALENGSLDLWDAEQLISGSSETRLSRTTKHTGPIKSLQFNPLKPQLLATAGAGGELFVYDVNDISNPFRLGSAAAARADDLECVAWNRKVPHILATGGSGGFVTVWDLKTRKASLTLNNSRKAVSAIAWDPNNSTKLLTATPDDNTPVILLWDLRNSNAPEKTLQGHEAGVLSLSWCQQDSDLLLSSGKDNRTLLWNPQTGTQYGELPEVTNWTFLTRFHPSNPNLSATASFDGKITVQTLQNTNPTAVQTTTQENLDGEDFFAKAQSQPQGASFSLTKAPAWLERPIGASFGFGGKLLVFKQKPNTAGQPRSSSVKISTFSADSSIGDTTMSFEAALEKNEIKELCESRLADATTDTEKADWKVMETLLTSNPREGVVEYLGFSKDEVTNDVAAEEDTPKEGTEPSTESLTNGTVEPKSKRLSTLFDGADGDDFLSDLAATRGAKTDDPFQLLGNDKTSLEDRITKALILGDFATATDICVKENRIADAFIIANCGGKDLVEKVQASYLAEKQGRPSYLRLLSSVVTDNLWDVVYNADLANWKETMATLCTFAKPADFPDLCVALGDRISQEMSNKDATFCYLVGGKLEKVVGIWLEELQETEASAARDATEDSTFSIHARSLQHFIEKVTIFRRVSKYTDSEADASSGWHLAALYDRYTEYADIMSAHGFLAVAQRYLDLIPAKYPAADVARNRVRLALATKPAATARIVSTNMRQQAATARSVSTATTRAVSGPRAQPQGYQPAQPVIPAANPYPAPVQNPATNPYAAPVPAFNNSYAPAAASNPYAPPAQQFGQPAGGYAPSGGMSGYAPPAPYGHVQPSAPPMSGPPRNGTPSQNPPLLRAKDVGDWNDVPLVTKPPARKNTPRAAPIVAPFPGQTSPAMAPPPMSNSSYGVPRGTATPPPPPPKTGESLIATPSTGMPPATLSRQSTTTAPNPYAPPPPPPSQPGAVPMNATVPRTASPFTAPPPGGPSTNRYAPSPAPQHQQMQAPPSQPYGAQPPQMSRPPPTNPYAPSVAQQQQQQQQYQQPPPSSQYAPAASPYNAPPPPGAGSRPPVGPPPSGPPAAATPPPSKAAQPLAKTRYPPGDRSHIPPNAQRLVDIMSQDMQRIMATAPPGFSAQVKDTNKRLNLLFDHLNNGELVKPDTIDQLSQLADALQAKDYELAHKIQVDIHENKTEECGNWIVGVKRLITMSKASS